MGTIYGERAEKPAAAMLYPGCPDPLPTRPARRLQRPVKGDGSAPGDYPLRAGPGPQTFCNILWICTWYALPLSLRSATIRAAWLPRCVLFITILFQFDQQSTDFLHV